MTVACADCCRDMKLRNMKLRKRRNRARSEGLADVNRLARPGDALRERLEEDLRPRGIIHAARHHMRVSACSRRNRQLPACNSFAGSGIRTRIRTLRPGLPWKTGGVMSEKAA